MPYGGDPGFLSGLGKVFGAVGSVIPGIGGVVSKIGGALAKVGAKHPTLSAAGAAAATSVVSGAAGAAATHFLSGPGGGMRMGSGVMPGGSMTTMRGALGPVGASARGYHMSKPRKCGGVLIPPHLVRNRRMRATNPKALRRAIRRAKGFERLARKVMHFVSPRAHKGRAVFKTKRRR